MKHESGSVIVVGGGVIGAACAHFLVRSGRSVTIVDQGEFGAGCSHANCGLVCPSHVLPLAGPGAVKNALATFFQRNGPVKIKLRFDPALWRWLWKFSRRCNEKDMIESGRGIKPLLDSSRSLYSALIRDEALDCEWEERGLLFVLASEKGMEHYTAVDELMTREFGVQAKRFSSGALVDFEPALKPGLAGGWWYEGDAHLRPDRLLAAWKSSLQKHGVSIRENTAVQAIESDGKGATAVHTNAGKLAADAFVFATGALARLFSRQLGCWLPIQPGKGYSMTMSRPARCPRVPIIFEEHRVVVTPMQSGYRLGSMMEFSGYDATLDSGRLSLLKEAAQCYLHEPCGDTMEEEWFGWRPMTYDGKPIIDFCPRMSNVLIAAGHNTLGLSMAPATGKLVAELLNGQAPHIDPRHYSVARFQAR
jgi:D-amino-acid dehydrogenase